MAILKLLYFLMIDNGHQNGENFGIILIEKSSYKTELTQVLPKF